MFLLHSNNIDQVNCGLGVLDVPYIPKDDLCGTAIGLPPHLAVWKAVRHGSPRQVVSGIVGCNPPGMFFVFFSRFRKQIRVYVDCRTPCVSWLVGNRPHS